MKDNNTFDAQLKTTLENLEVPYDPGTWDLLQGRMDAPFAEEHPAPVEPVDTAVLRVLNTLEMPYQAAHWDLMAAQLTARLRLRRIWISKTAEAALVLLLLLNLGTFSGKHPAQRALPRPHSDVPVADRMPSKNGRPKTAGRDILSANAMLGAPALVADAAQAVATPVAADYLACDYLSAPTVSDVLQMLANGYEPGAPADPTVIAAVAPVGALPPDAFQALALPDRWTPLHPVQIKKSRTYSPFYVSSFASSDYNRVYTGNATRNVGGYGGGIAVGYRQGKWGLETGFSYARRQYQPKKEIEIIGGNFNNGYYGTLLDNVDADLINVPVKVSRRLARAGRTSLHLSAGVTASIAAQKAYQYKSVFYPGQAPSGSPGQGAPAADRPEGKGILEKGRLAGNIYATADAGIRVEHALNRKLTAFVEPVYRQSLSSNSFGPKPARINTFSVQAGVMASL